ncbi:hypothetical protein D3C85_1358150 [compost metagenome]
MISGSICGLASFGWITVLTVQGYLRTRRDRRVLLAAINLAPAREIGPRDAAKHLFHGGWSFDDLAVWAKTDADTIRVWAKEDRWDV